MSNKYPLAVGEADRLRLEILNKMYNPLALYFLKRNGLKPGTNILEIGCGAGDMACMLAQEVGEHGSVVAIDNSPEQIAICNEKAKKHGLNNIKFICLDFNEVDTLDTKFDMSCGRWSISYSLDPLSVFKKIASVLRPGGILTYETAAHLDSGYFTFPEAPVVKQWFEAGSKALADNFSSLDLGVSMYGMLVDMGLGDINTLINQPIMQTAEEKSVMRLAVLTTKKNALKVMTESEYDIFVSDLEAFEKSATIGGFYRNILMAGRVS